MIKNERQYRITKARFEEFERTLHGMTKNPATGVHPRIQQAQRDAVRSQLDELQEEITAYEALQAGQARVLECASLDQLPAALIQARIAVGLTQRELAQRLGMKEQQLQRYEATNYAGASLDRIQAVAGALGVQVREEVFLPGADVSPAHVVRRATTAGLSKDFITKRILPRKGRGSGSEDADALSGATLLNRIFGWAPATLFGDTPLHLANAALVGARYKLPSSAATRATEAYAAYASYVASLVIRATPTLRSMPIPIDPMDVRAAILATGDMTFASGLDYTWSLGIPVLPLSDPGAFHGATWRIAGRNVIVLKQGTRSESRWLHDLLHELRHAAEEPEAVDFSFIDYDTLAKETLSSPAETTASLFAGDVQLAGRAEELAKMCAKRAGGSIERLKAVVPQVAKTEAVPVGALANYMAFRLSLQGQSWWGAATNLQVGGADPYEIARARIISQIDLSRLDDTERTILLRALEGDAT